MHKDTPDHKSGEFWIGNDLRVNRLGFGAMRITGKGVWGEPADRAEAIRVLRRAVELGINFIDTADSYGPHVSEEIIAEALYPYPAGLVIATKGGLRPAGPGQMG
jgi:pyridoxine 4-dehydrogenase